MSNKVVTNVNMNRGVGYDDAVYADDTLTLAGNDELAAGTILARDSISGKLVLFVKGGVTNENGIPKAVITDDYSATAGAGDYKVRVLIEGRCIKQRLVIDADGDDSNIDAAVIDQLRDYGITPEQGRELYRNEA